MRAVDRRTFLVRSAGLVCGAVFSSPLVEALHGRQALAQGGCTLAAGEGEGGYGPLQPAGPELALPAGFTYRRFSVMGTPMSDGRPTPSAHDGMAAFALPNGNVRLVRNHEIPGLATPELLTVAGDPLKGYDPGGQGGTTSLEIKVMPDGDRRLVRDFVSLSGTIMNCAGGPTPWGSWLSCEETTQGGPPLRQPHGYCFEVRARANEEVRATPLKALGRFVHEAVAVDPATGIVYETEDQSRAGLYRFIPDQPGLLAAGGRLEMLGIAGAPNSDLSNSDPSQAVVVGQPLPVTWFDIADPDPDDAEENPSAVFEQGDAQGAARFRRLEGCWYGEDSIYFTSTSGGAAGLGQVWQYQPAAGVDGQLTLVFESTEAACLDGPDNITVSPRGGILICEDGGGEQYLRGLTAAGKVFDFALNRITQREFAGATFSPDGQTLFVNIQGDIVNPGMTFAIWGPWGRGAL